MLITNENYVYMIWNYTPTLLLKNINFELFYVAPEDI